MTSFSFLQTKYCQQNNLAGSNKNKHVGYHSQHVGENTIRIDTPVTNRVRTSMLPVHDQLTKGHRSKTTVAGFLRQSLTPLLPCQNKTTNQRAKSKTLSLSGEREQLSF